MGWGGAKEDGRALANSWFLETGDDKKDLWCGIEPASLFRSSDGGDFWEIAPGISNHEHARKWSPGNCGLCMHTIYHDGLPLSDPRPRHPQLDAVQQVQPWNMAGVHRLVEP